MKGRFNLPVFAIIGFSLLFHTCGGDNPSESQQVGETNKISVRGTYAIEPSSEGETLFLDGEGNVRYTQSREERRSETSGTYHVAEGVLRIHLPGEKVVPSGVFVQSQTRGIWSGRWMGAYKRIRLYDGIK